MDTLTRFEKLSMANVCNLSDGHARQKGTLSQQEIINNLATIYNSSIDGCSQIEIENLFKKKFYQLGGQREMLLSQNIDRSLICYSSSNACEIVGNYLRLNGLTTMLIEPTFDNLPRILKRHGVTLISIPEEIITGDIEQLNKFEFQALFLVLPNNPTGLNLGKIEFIEIVKYCKRKKILLIIDFAFRFFSTLSLWDQYEILEKYEIDFITLEDTGKTWAMADLKVGMIVPSRKIFKKIDEIHDDYLLNVSPFILNFLIEFIDNSLNYGLENSILQIVHRNRLFLRDKILNLPLSALSSYEINVDWLRIEIDISANQIYSALVKRNVHILPGNNFYWNTPEKGNRYIRLPLARNEEEFIFGVETLCDEFTNLINKI